MFKLLSELTDREYVVVGADYGTTVIDATRDLDSYDLHYMGMQSLRDIKDEAEHVYDAIIDGGAEGVDPEVENIEVYEGIVKSVSGSESVKVYIPDFWQ
jgi:predicted fused transcriptional regulator/phosphomethylpyrimidine kinase